MQLLYCQPSAHSERCMLDQQLRAQHSWGFHTATGAGAAVCTASQILSNFGVDVLEALSSTCTLYTQSSIGLMQLLSDLLVAFLLITAHGSVLMCQVGEHGARDVCGDPSNRCAV